MRGVILGLSPSDVVDRATLALRVDTEIQYCADPGKNGGTSPAAPFCASRWRLDGRWVVTSDCVGFATWCLGTDRWLDGPDEDQAPDTWYNTDSMLADAAVRRRYFHSVEIPIPSDLVVFPSTYRAGKRVRMGHVGVLVQVPAGVTASNRASWKLAEVAHCHGPPMAGTAITRATARTWSKHPGARFLRFRGLA